MGVVGVLLNVGLSGVVGVRDGHRFSGELQVSYTIQSTCQGVG